MTIKYITIYILALWIISTVLTIYDKIAAKQKWRRTQESTLLWLGFLGSAGIMLGVMQLIRHKTDKKKFMVRLPLFLILHIVLLALYCYLQYGA